MQWIDIGVCGSLSSRWEVRVAIDPDTVVDRSQWEFAVVQRISRGAGTSWADGSGCGEMCSRGDTPTSFRLDQSQEFVFGEDCHTEFAGFVEFAAGFFTGDDVVGLA